MSPETWAEPDGKWLTTSQGDFSRAFQKHAHNLHDPPPTPYTQSYSNWDAQILIYFAMFTGLEVLIDFRLTFAAGTCGNNWLYLWESHWIIHSTKSLTDWGTKQQNVYWWWDEKDLGIEEYKSFSPYWQHAKKCWLLRAPGDELYAKGKDCQSESQASKRISTRCLNPNSHKLPTFIVFSGQ